MVCSLRKFAMGRFSRSQAARAINKARPRDSLSPSSSSTLGTGCKTSAKMPTHVSDLPNPISRARLDVVLAAASSSGRRTMRLFLALISAREGLAACGRPRAAPARATRACVPHGSSAILTTSSTTSRSPPNSFTRTVRSAVTCPRAMVVLASTASIPPVVVTPVASTTTGL